MTVGAAEGGTTRRGRWKPEKRRGEEKKKKGEGAYRGTWSRRGNDIRVVSLASSALDGKREREGTTLTRFFFYVGLKPFRLFCVGMGFSLYNNTLKKNKLHDIRQMTSYA